MQGNSAIQATSKTALLLLFHIEENLYAIDTSNVIEVAPVVLLRKITTAPDYIAGVFNYHNTIVPVIDLCQVLRGTPCQLCYSTRLIMVNAWIDSPPNEDSTRQQQQFGLMAERVIETLRVPTETLAHAETMGHASILGELFIEEKGLIQKVNWEHLIADYPTFAGRSEQGHDAGRY